MGKAQIIVNQHSTLDFGVYLQYPIVLAHPQVDLNPVQIPGHSGDLLANNHRFQNITQTFNLVIKKPSKYITWSSLSLALQEWLVSDTYQTIILDTLHGWYWEGYLSSPPVITPTNDCDATGSISFNCKPYMKRIDSIDFEPVPSMFFNTTDSIAEPIIHIVGNGNFTINVNGTNYELIDVSEEVFIDSEQSWIYQHDEIQNRASWAHFPNNDFPILKQGQNTISITGNYSKFEYKPNWRRLA